MNSLVGTTNSNVEEDFEIPAILANLKELIEDLNYYAEQFEQGTSLSDYR